MLDEWKCISTSVLVVACAVGGLVFLALVTSVVIICYKNYQDKRATRVRRLQQHEAINSPRLRGVEPLKPPEYVTSPPEYSAVMPESHYRPVTVNGHVSYNQRFRGMTPLPERGNIAATRTSGRCVIASSQLGTLGTAQIPGVIQGEAPPPYSEFARGRTPANRRQRLITTPIQEETNNSNSHNVSTSHSIHRRNTDTPLSSVSSVSGSRLDTDTPSSRPIESRVESRQELQSRSQTVAGVLGARTPHDRNVNNSIVTPSTYTIESSGGGFDLNRRGLSPYINSSVPGSISHASGTSNFVIEDLTTV
ncbi:hypothetical protein ACF0H5_013179 [Mactra antiquata]